MRKRAFAALYDRIAPRTTEASRRYRERLIADLEGRVLEIGCGPGNNFDFYPASVELTATDYNEHMLRRARLAAADAAASITVEQADVHALPFGDNSFDAVVSTLVLCSVDQQQALGEIRRVLRPGGTLRMWEHVRSDRTLTTVIQRVASPLWSLIADGCHMDRDTARAVQEAGFELALSERVSQGLPHLLMVAHLPAES